MSLTRQARRVMRLRLYARGIHQLAEQKGSEAYDAYPLRVGARLGSPDSPRPCVRCWRWARGRRARASARVRGWRGVVRVAYSDGLDDFFGRG